MMSVRRIAPVCLLLALSAPSAVSQDVLPGPNYVHAPDMRALLHWEHFPLHIFFPTSRLASRERKALVQAGFDQWVQATHGIVRYQIVTTEAQADVTVTLTSRARTSEFSTVGGLTMVTCAGAVLKKASMEIVEKDDDPTAFQEVAAHEFGHALGLNGHSNDPNDIMYPVVTDTLLTLRNDETTLPASARRVTRRDVNTLRAAYPADVFASLKH